jgi:hypothetical protein
LYDGDARAIVAAVPYAGYRLISFTGGPVNGNPSQFSGSDTYGFPIDRQDWQFSVSFRQEFTITVGAEGGGAASGTGTYVDGESCTVTAVPEEGKILDGWYENGTKVSSDLNYTFTVSSNRTLTAKFKDEIIIIDEGVSIVSNIYTVYLTSRLPVSTAVKSIITIRETRYIWDPLLNDDVLYSELDDTITLTIMSGDTKSNTHSFISSATIGYDSFNRSIISVKHEWINSNQYELGNQIWK